MPEEFSFKNMMESSDPMAVGRATHKLKAGDSVDVAVIHIGPDTVFVDAGTPSDGRIPRDELQNADGELTVREGDRLKATVVNPDPAGPILAVSFGGRADADLGTISLAHESGAPVVGTVTALNKGGLEVAVGNMRAFCPASQVELSRVNDLSVYVEQQLEFKVIELRDSGRSVVLSRRALLEDRRKESARGARERILVGSDVEAEVTSLNRHGVVLELEGVEGFVHISELARHRIEKPEDVVNVGDRVKARVLSVEEGSKGLQIRLSMKALQQPEAARDAPGDEILDATVTGAAKHGVFVQTKRGEGLVPMRELGLPPGSDHRRAYPVGKQLRVVMVGSGGGKLTFSSTKVTRVEERSNYREFSSGSKASAATSLGSFGDLFSKKLGITRAPAPSEKSPRRSEPAPAEPASHLSPPPRGSSSDELSGPSVEVAAPTQPLGPKKAPSPRADIPGVVRRKR